MPWTARARLGRTLSTREGGSPATAELGIGSFCNVVITREDVFVFQQALIDGVWFVLPVVAGLACLIKGRYVWATVGLLPLALVSLVALVQFVLGEVPDWLEVVGAVGLISIAFAPAAAIGAVLPTKSGSLLAKRSRSQARDGDDARDTTNVEKLRTALGWALAIVAVTAAISVTTVSIG